MQAAQVEIACGEKVLKTEQNRWNREITRGNRPFAVDKAFQRVEGELRYGTPDPHEH